MEDLHFVTLGIKIIYPFRRFLNSARAITCIVMTIYALKSNVFILHTRMNVIVLHVHVHANLDFTQRVEKVQAVLQGLIMFCQRNSGKVEKATKQVPQCS